MIKILKLTHLIPIAKGVKFMILMVHIEKFKVISAYKWYNIVYVPP